MKVQLIDHEEVIKIDLYLFISPGNGDILSYEDAMTAKETGVSGIMIAR